MRVGSDYAFLFDECSDDEIPIFSIFGDMSPYAFYLEVGQGRACRR
jgi:hypothetical protein